MNTTLKNVEDVYPLSPMQEMMLLHALASKHTDVLFNQFCYEIHGDLNVSAFREAWQQILNRHAALRTAFVWENLKQPLQIVRQLLELPFEHLDWQDWPVQKQETELASLLHADGQRGFNPTNAPLTRLAIVQLAPDHFYFIWSSHHLIVDRWCLSSLFNELFAFYESNCHGQPVHTEDVRPYRDYITWIQRQNPVDAAAFWRTTLQGFSEPTQITVDGDERGVNGDDGGPTSTRLEFTQDKTDAFRTFARQHGLTVSTLFQGAWALLLNHYTGRQDVLFGAAVSGRPPDLPGVESMVGSFINNLPVRVRLSRDEPLVEWLRAIQLTQQKRIPFEYVSLAEIQQWCDLSPTQRMYDGLLIWLSREEPRDPEGLTFRGLSGNLKTAYPFTLSISEDDRFAVQAFRGAHSRTVAPITQIVEQLAANLDAIVTAEANTPLGELQGFRGEISFQSSMEAETHGPAAVKGNGQFPASEVEDTPPPEGREAFEAEMLQDMLVSEWRHVLGSIEIGLDDNFFDLGGTSLVAAQLHSRIENTTRQAIPLLSLFQSPTVREMARTLAAKSWPIKPGILTPILAQGSKPPLFCIASPEVNAVGYAILAGHLDTERPVYLLQSPPATDEVRRIPPMEMPDLSATYIAAMKSVQPTGPYHLLSMCIGAHMAVEMAKQLENSKDEDRVAFLGIVDTWATFTVTWLYNVQRVLNRVHYYAERINGLRRLEPREQISTLRRVAGNRLSNLKQSMSSILGSDTQTTAPADQPVSWIEEVGWAKKEGDISKYSGTVTLLRMKRTRQQFYRVRDPGLGWSKLAESVHVDFLPGADHDAILRNPDVEILAEKINGHLESAGAGAEAPERDPRSAIGPMPAKIDNVAGALK